MENDSSIALDALMADLKKGPYVYREDGAYVFLLDRDNRQNYYDISDSACKDAENVVDWIAHLSEKSWVTNDHIGQFCLLSMARLGIRRR